MLAKHLAPTAAQPWIIRDVNEDRESARPVYAIHTGGKRYVPGYCNDCYRNCPVSLESRDGGDTGRCELCGGEADLWFAGARDRVALCLFMAACLFPDSDPAGDQYRCDRCATLNSWSYYREDMPGICAWCIADPTRSVPKSDTRESGNQTEPNQGKQEL